jgi:hypothetical protein
MKMNKNIIWALAITVIVASLFRVIPNRVYGFTPQLALAIFSGAIIKDKRLAFLLPLVSMFISDLIYQGLYLAGITPIYGFYQGQWINYLLIISVTAFGFFLKKIKATNVLLVSLAGPTYFFLVSNFLTWAGVGDFVEYPKTFQGLMQSYAAGLPFYKNSLIGTMVFSAILFGSWYLMNRKVVKPVTA